MTADTGAMLPVNGFSVVGEFLSVGQGKSWTGTDGKERHPVVVTLLVGDRTVRVEYPDASSAEYWTLQVQRGDRLAVPCYAQSPKGTTTVFYRGLRAPSARDES